MKAKTIFIMIIMLAVSQSVNAKVQMRFESEGVKSVDRSDDLVFLCISSSYHPGDTVRVANDFEKYISDGNFFTVMVPQDWEKEEDIILGREAKEYGVILIGPRGKDKIPVMITVLYYGDGKDTHAWLKSAEDFIRLNTEAKRPQLLEGEEYGAVRDTTCAGRKAKTFDKREFMSTSSSQKILISKRFVIVPAAIGFYKLQYEAPFELAKKYERVFDKVSNSFNPNLK